MEGSLPPAPLEHQHQAGFVPPIVQITNFPTSITTDTTITGSDDSYNDSDDSLSQSFWSDSSSVDPIVNNGSSKYTKSRSSKSRGASGRKPRRNENVNRLN